jgi:hypothetical protein
MRRTIALVHMISVMLVAGIGRSQSADEVLVRTDSELRDALKIAPSPGHVIRIAPGTYSGGHSVSGWQGTSENPIRLTAADPNDLPVIHGGGNAFHFSRVAHITIDSLIISGCQQNGLNIDDGGKSEEPSHHVVLKNLTVQDIGSGGNHDGVKLSGLTDFEVDGCRLSNWGRNGSAIDMVGCHRGEISGCVFQGREEDGGNGVQTKGGSSEIRILASRFEHVGSRGVNLGGSTGLPFFRPMDSTHEARNIAVEDCVFIGSHAPIAFVGVDGATVRHNTFYLPGKYVMRILQENTRERFIRCRNGIFERNLTVFDSDKVGSMTNIGPQTLPDTFMIRDNAWHSIDGRARSPRLDIKETGATVNETPSFMNIRTQDLRQSSSSPTHEFGSRSESAAKPVGK